MNAIKGFDIVFPREYMRAALLVSLLSVWVLVGLFHYLNRYTRRYYFTIWTAAWLFYACWLTIGISLPGVAADSFVLVLRQWCLSLSAVFLMWGSISFLEKAASQTLLGLFMLFLLSWSYAGRAVLKDTFYLQIPVFILTGLASMFSGMSFYRVRRRRRFVAAGLLCLGFVLWGVYLISYPFAQKYDVLTNACFLFSAVLQLFIAVSMIVLVLEEARQIHDGVLQEIGSVNTEKRELQLKVLSVEARCRSLFHQTELRNELQCAYDNLRHTQSSVIQQERLRALGQMASGIAHDINNALSPILTFSELVLEKEMTNLSVNSRNNLATIHTAAEDIAQIVARMSEFHRRNERHEQLRRVSINRVVGQVIELTSPRWRDLAQRRGLAIEVKPVLDESLPELYGNETELREALTNLVFNAVDALPSGGLILLSTRAISFPAVSAPEPHPTHLLLEVRDNGMGMDEATRQRCLEPFFSTKRDRGGSGLGLAMVYGTVERHEGRIEIESEVNRGTAIKLILPVRQGPPAPIAASPTSCTLTEPLRILCIDDEPLLRDLLKELLEFHQHQVTTASGGQPGLQAFNDAKSRGTPFDVVLTDLGMPGVGGREVAEKIKAQSRATPVILLTGWGAMLEAKGEGAGQADAVLSKPPRAAELFETLAKVTSRRRVSPPATDGSLPETGVTKLSPAAGKSQKGKPSEN